jgi:hypothetical protein
MGIEELLDKHKKALQEFDADAAKAKKSFEASNENTESSKRLGERSLLHFDLNDKRERILSMQYYELAKEAISIEIKERMEEKRRELEEKRKERGFKR